jgi:hypothetical protein
LLDAFVARQFVEQEQTGFDGNGEADSGFR